MMKMTSKLINKKAAYLFFCQYNLGSIEQIHQSYIEVSLPVNSCIWGNNTALLRPETISCDYKVYADNKISASGSNVKLCDIMSGFHLNSNYFQNLEKDINKLTPTFLIVRLNGK